MALGARIFNTSTHITLLSLGNGVTVLGLDIEGAGNGSAVSNSHGIDIIGASAASLKIDITLRDCYIHNIGFYGVYMEFADDILIDHCRIENIGYAGVMGYLFSTW